MLTNANTGFLEAADVEMVRPVWKCLCHQPESVRDMRRRFNIGR